MDVCLFVSGMQIATSPLHQEAVRKRNQRGSAFNKCIDRWSAQAYISSFFCNLILFSFQWIQTMRFCENWVFLAAVSFLRLHNTLSNKILGCSYLAFLVVNILTMDLYMGQKHLVNKEPWNLALCSALIVSSVFCLLTQSYVKLKTIRR